MRIFYCFFLLLFFSANHSLAQGYFKIIGNADPMYNGLKLELKGDFDSSLQVIESTVQNGRFNLEGFIDEKYKRVSLSSSNGGNLEDLYFFITNSTMELSITPGLNRNSPPEISLTNFPLAEDEERYIESTKPIEDSLRLLGEQIRRSKVLKVSNIDSLKIIYENMRDLLFKRNYEFIKNNGSNYFSLYIFNLRILSSLKLDLFTLVSLFSVFEEDIRGTRLGVTINSTLNKKQALYLKSEMPEISFVTNLGEKYAISQFQDKKHVLLCFWASWCVSCIENIPRLKKFHENFSDNVQFISISIDDDKRKWIEAEKKYQMPWLQTCDIEAFTSQKIREDYDINWIPQYFLIDKEGLLVYNNFMSMDDDDYSKLESLLKQISD